MGSAAKLELALEFKLCSVKDAAAMARFYVENEAHLRPWEPLRRPGFHRPSAWAERLRFREQEQQAGHAFYFLAFDGASGDIVATCSLSGIARGPMEAAYIGYSVDRRYEGRGVMKALCEHVIDFAFNRLHLHRIMANYMPANERSGGLLKCLGFEREGYAKQYLQINGRWEDHVLTALINPRDTGRR